MEVYSTMSETKAAFAERAIQSLKHIIYIVTLKIIVKKLPSKCSSLLLH